MATTETRTDTAPLPQEVPHTPTIVNPDPRYGPVRLVEPTRHGYIYIGAEVWSPRPPFLPRGRKRSAFLRRLNELVRPLQQLDAVVQVSVFDAIAIAPVRSAYLKERADSVRAPRFDVVVLIETTSPAVAHDVQSTPEYRDLVHELEGRAQRLHMFAARNAKRVGNVDETSQATFLFNYFVADDAGVMLRLWDYLAGWYAVETGLDNSLLLVPQEGEHADYLAINHARWDESLPRFLWKQFSRKSFRTYVLANLEANRVGSMPALYRLANLPRRPARAMPSWTIALGALALGAALAAWRRFGAGRRIAGA